MALRKFFLGALAAVTGLFLLALAAGYFFSFQEIRQWTRPSLEVPAGREWEAAKKKNQQILKKMEALPPKGIYIIIDTGENKFYLKKGAETIRQGLVSTGSGDILEDPSGKRQWIFDTPRGRYTVKSKIHKPYWVKPDWAFIEEGEAIPKNLNDRVEVGVLGDYALGFGSGYFIHGTLYTRLLGRNVTHGCVRMGDEDLETVYKAASIGTKIFIY